MPMDLDAAACYRALATRDVRFDGRIFVGVRTTGIYCRPICPARTPKRENVEFFPSAAAAQEAGYRPCLRCRPETSPDLGAWRGTSNTVSRALALIDSGALDAGDVEGLAGRLGLGARQLRRLFRQHLGASPIAVAQSRRVLLAKQLLHETRLPMSEVALAAGFGSVRRFNETFQRLYQRPPSALRRERGRPAKGAASGSRIVLRLPCKAPYDFAALLGFLRPRALPGVEVVEEGGYRRAIAMDGAVGTLAVEPGGDGASVRATICFPRVTALPEIIARVRRLFDLVADPVAIGAQLSRDALLAPLVAARPGLRVPGAWDGVELAVRAILGQQVTVRAATTLAGRLIAAHGEPLPPDARLPGVERLFPSPERLAAADLTSMGMPGARARAITSLASAAAAEPGLFLPGQDADAAVARLRSLPGIGDWTAQYICLRALHEADAFPSSDLALLRALADGAGVKPTPARVLERAEAWRPWRAYAAMHLWASDAATPSPRARIRKESHEAGPRSPRVAARHAAARH